MPLPRPRFTVRRLMVVVAIAGFESGLGSFLYHEAQAGDGAATPWFETGVQLAFLNLLIGGPFWLFLRAIASQNGSTVRK